MSDDLVKRLRQSSSSDYSCQGCMDTEREEAVSRIEKLEAALEPFADLAYEIDGEMYERLAHNLEDGLFIRARKALEGKDD